MTHIMIHLYFKQCSAEAEGGFCVAEALDLIVATQSWAWCGQRQDVSQHTGGKGSMDLWPPSLREDSRSV